jgi:hypothetical protein
MGKRLISSEDLTVAQNFMNRALFILDSHDLQLPALHLEASMLALQTEMLALGLEHAPAETIGKSVDFSAGDAGLPSSTTKPA